MPHRILCLLWPGLLTLFISPAVGRPRPASDTLLVCGQFTVLMVAVSLAPDSLPQVVWQWSAQEATDLPTAYRQTYFEKMDECKPVDGGRRVLVTSSSGGVALLDRQTKRVLFYGFVPNAHSAARLPDHRIVVAGSIRPGGNCLTVFADSLPATPLCRDSLYSGHGVVWDSGRQRLYSLGFRELNRYRLANWQSPRPALVREQTWLIPATGGHDLQALPGQRDRFVVTAPAGVWLFNAASGQFDDYAPLRGLTEIKSVSEHPGSGRIAFVRAEESWWAHHVGLSRPDGILAFPALNVYKARWLTAD